MTAIKIDVVDGGGGKKDPGGKISSSAVTAGGLKKQPAWRVWRQGHGLQFALGVSAMMLLLGLWMSIPLIPYLLRPKFHPRKMDWTTNNCATVRLAREYKTFDYWKKRWPGISNLEEECNETTLVERTDTCAVSLVESIPQGLYVGGTGTARTSDVFRELIRGAKSKIQIASSYWSLRAEDTHTDPDQEPTTRDGQSIFDLLKLRAEEGITIEIAQSQNSTAQPDADTAELSRLPSVTLKQLDFPRLIGAGILHTKMMLVDGTDFYVGSNNFDWRSFTQVKEMGVYARGCPKLGEDMRKIFEVYWMVGGPNATIPDQWPTKLDTNITRHTPLALQKPGLDVYLSSSPQRLCPAHRDSDITSVLGAIGAAEKFVYVAVMDYFPVTIYQKEPQFYPRVDDALRKAAIERGVEVRLLLSNWTDTRPAMLHYLQSLTAIDQPDKNISVKGRYFQVPSNVSQAKIPFARVNHNKYIVTDREALIMTSNWAADYFLYTGGIGFGFKTSTESALEHDAKGTGSLARAEGIHKQLTGIFLRDWESPYATKDL